MPDSLIDNLCDTWINEKLSESILTSQIDNLCDTWNNKKLNESMPASLIVNLCDTWINEKLSESILTSQIDNLCDTWNNKKLNESMPTSLIDNLYDTWIIKKLNESMPTSLVDDLCDTWINIYKACCMAVIQIYSNVSVILFLCFVSLLHLVDTLCRCNFLQFFACHRSVDTFMYFVLYLCLSLLLMTLET